MKNGIVAGLLVLFLIAGVGGGYLVGSNSIEGSGKNSSTATTTSTKTTSPTASECPLLVGCGPYPVLSIREAMAQVGSSGPAICQTTNFTAVCPVYIIGGDSGRVILNASFQVPQPGAYVGGAYVAFLIYSSAANYVSFTSIPACAFTSGPNLNVPGCNVPSNGQAEFQFAFSVSSSYGNSSQRWPDSVTVDMWQTCCFA